MNWENFKGKVREQWGDLADDDASDFKGKWQQFSGLMQQKYGYAKERAEAEMHSLRSKWNPQKDDNQDENVEQKDIDTKEL